MSIKKYFCIVILFGCISPVVAQVTKATNERRQLRFAERVIMIELSRALSPALRLEQDKCPARCVETGAMELSIGLIGISRSDEGTEALVNLLGLQLDGAGSEELSCQILTRGKPLLRRLERMNVERVSQHCQVEFMALKKRELASVSDVQVDQVCRSEIEIRNVRDDLVKALKSKVGCEL